MCYSAVESNRVGYRRIILYEPNHCHLVFRIGIHPKCLVHAMGRGAFIYQKARTDQADEDAIIRWG